MAPINLNGSWILRGGQIASILSQLTKEYWIGCLQICNMEIISIWKSDGDHFNESKLDLIERIRDAKAIPKI